LLNFRRWHSAQPSKRRARSTAPVAGPEPLPRFNDCIRRPKSKPEAVMDVLSLLQWPAMVVTLIAAWLVASQSRARRNWGFWTFILSNLLWIVWGWHEDAIALIVLQVGLFVLNLRGARKNEPGRG
jgi:hypothetical protein